MSEFRSHGTPPTAPKPRTEFVLLKILVGKMFREMQKQMETAGLDSVWRWCKSSHLKSTTVFIFNFWTTLVSWHCTVKSKFSKRTLVSSAEVFLKVTRRQVPKSPTAFKCSQIFNSSPTVSKRSSFHFQCR